MESGRPAAAISFFPVPKSEDGRSAGRRQTVTFVTVAIILSGVHRLMVDARDPVRASEVEKLSVAEKVFTRSKRPAAEQLAAIATVAENPTLKAALEPTSGARLTGLPAEQ